MRGTDRRMYGSRTILAFLVVVGTWLAMVPLHPAPAPAAGVVGTGTPESCTEAALDAALVGGGLVTFDCGAEPTTIRIISLKAISADTIIDGAYLLSIHPYPEAYYTAFDVEAGVTLAVDRLIIDGHFGAVNDGATVRITDSSVFGEIRNRSGSVSATRSILRDIFNDGGSVSVTSSTTGEVQNIGGNVRVSDTFVADINGIGNSGGGVVDVANSTFSIGGCLFGCGGTAIENDSGSVTVTNATISVNYEMTATIVGEVTLRNTIVVGPGLGAMTDDGSHNIFGGFDDLRLDSYPQDHGGPTPTFALLAGSPAIDAGDAAVCAASPVNNLDQRGYVRPGLGHTRCSIGAYEPDAVPLAVCVGDCNGDGAVAIDELILGVNIVLGLAVQDCPAFTSGHPPVDIAQLITGVNNALNGCGSG